MNSLGTYLKDIQEIRSTGGGTSETSYYPPLAGLFNEVGKGLKPRVRCVIHLADQGSGIPDGGFFSANQFRRKGDLEPLTGQIPERGALEVKGPGEDVEKTARSEQVKKYWERYRQVLVTNLRDFLLVGTDTHGRQVQLERFTLDNEESDFWARVGKYRNTSNELSLRLEEFVKRVMLHAAPISKPEDMAWFLASYARDARLRIETAQFPALDQLRSALEQALGIEFIGEKGERFFRSTLVQTLFYGIFAAWVLWHREGGSNGGVFKWREAGWYLKVPMLQNLFTAIAQPINLEPVNLKEVLDWTTSVLNRVDRETFFARFEEEHAVQYFYEPFLSAFDPELRKELGVWYTPAEIVQYMVARVDQALRTELGIPDGLADPRVYVLDPCCGTGAFLVETIRKIGETLESKGADALTMHEVKTAAIQRVFGFEIMPAPFVIAHLQIGLVLGRLGVPLSAREKERAGVFLTNSLTGWEPPKEPKTLLTHYGLEKEVEAADEIKRDKPILVVIGNPPYNAFAGVSPKEERGLVDPYKVGLNKPVKDGGWGIRKFNLDDLYVRFFRLAEHRIAEKTGKGIVCFISNFSYLSDPSFVVMRQRFLSEFGSMWFDCLNGDSRETGKLTPEGKPDPSVFSTELNREGIRVGTAVGLLVRLGQNTATPVVRFRQFWGVNKRRELLDSIKENDLNGQYETAAPRRVNRFSFRPAKVAANYLEWPRVTDLCAEPPSNGLMEKRGGALIDIDREALKERMKKYFDKKISWEEILNLNNGLSKNAASYNAHETRKKVLEIEEFDEKGLIKYMARPFDVTWCYYLDSGLIWNRSRPKLKKNSWEGNSFVVSRFKPSKTPEGVPFYFSVILADDHLMSPDSYCFSIKIKHKPLRKRSDTKNWLDDQEKKYPITCNFSQQLFNFFQKKGISCKQTSDKNADLIWHHVLSIGYSFSYYTENADGLRQDWPRIPLPNNKEALIRSAELGRRVAELLNPLEPVAGVTSGDIRPELREMGVITRVDGKPLRLDEGDLLVTAGWGYCGGSGITMPGKGRINDRPYHAGERSTLAAGAEKLGLSFEEVERRLGPSTMDVFLNETVYWKNVPANVWGYYIGGYQVIKKWLSYREESQLGRPLTLEEAREVRAMIRRIAVILLLGPSLDANYQDIKESTYSWPGNH